MKKTLVALAVLAASGAALAQATVTGNLTMGYRGTTTGLVNATSDAGGFGVDKSEMYLRASEDLGGGLKASALMTLTKMDRGNAAAVGGDATLTVTSGMGSLTLATVEEADYLNSIAGVGAYYNRFDGKVFSKRVKRDLVSLAAPVGPVTLTAAYLEAEKGLTLGEGTTGDGAKTDQSAYALGARFAEGPMVVHGEYRSYNSRTNGMKDEIRLSGAYDLGVAKLGAGMVVTTGEPNGRATDMLLGANVPLGALSLGAQYAERKIDDTTTSNGTTSGYSLQANYALSKRTSVIANWADWKGTVGNKNSTQYNLLLAHTF